MMAKPTGEMWALGALIFLFFSLQVAISAHHNLNWDEYLFLSQIYAYADGRLTEPFQTFHVHLLKWLTWLPGTEADQLVYGRLFMMVCEAGSLFCLYRMSRKLVSAPNALIAIAAWCATSYALVHGASFRTDALAGFLCMASLTVLVTSQLGSKQAFASALLAAVALLVTIKCVFFLPAFFGAFVWRWQEGEGKVVLIRHFGLAIVSLFAAYVTLRTFHIWSLGITHHAAAPALAGPPLSSESKAFHKVILSQALFPRGDYIILWAKQSALSLLLCSIGLWHAWTRSRRDFVAVVLFSAPILSLIIYRNAFPYFFPFIMLTVALGAGLGAEALKGGLLRWVVLVALFVQPLAAVPDAWQADQTSQREVARVAHRLFPHPVNYVDRNSMLPSFPKSGFFMSTWGVEEYLRAGKPALTKAVVRSEPPLLLLNSPLLEDAVTPLPVPPRQRLLPRDAETLRANYIEHWGPLWVAGKRVSAAGRFVILIGGTYTLECDGRRQLDGIFLPCNSTAHLATGPHSWGGGAATLRWGDHLPVPKDRPPSRPIFYGF